MIRVITYILLTSIQLILSVSCDLDSVSERFSKDGDVPKLPIGINVRETNYYSPRVPFNDLMKTASSMITFDVSGQNVTWDTKAIDSVPRDDHGWPLYLPVMIGEIEHGVRILLNNTIAGEHVLFHDGEGAYEWRNIEAHNKNGNVHVMFTGTGGHVYIEITGSKEGNPLRNMRLIPLEYVDSEKEMPLFRKEYLAGLEPFHNVRFMEWTKINNSEQVDWQDRPKPTDYTQGAIDGVSLEYAIELANTLRTDAWFCVPHRATKEYIREMARLIVTRLDPSLRCYIEYSNEVWNWQFDQAHWVLHNGISPQWPQGYREDTRSSESAVIEGLRGINALPADHPEKDAFMMSRVFKIFSEAFKGQEERLVRVAGVQHAWVDNTRRILEYLFDTDGVGCDAIASGGYFGFGEEDHKRWTQTLQGAVSPKMVLEAAEKHAESHEWEWTEKTAEYARKFDVDYLVYEGGQHIQPWKQEEWAYNQALWDAQTDPGMYELYLENFKRYAADNVNCKLFMAYCYLDVRESRYGSWGHLESVFQLGAANLVETAPKYQALIDVNTSRLGEHTE